MVPGDQHLGHQPIAVALDRAAQRWQLGRHALVRDRGVTERGQPHELGRRIGYRRRRGLRGAEQCLLAARQNDIARQIVDA